jgi:hypothetical protein
MHALSPLIPGIEDQMNAESQRNGYSFPLEPCSESDVLIPPFVKTIAVRLAWATAGEEAEIYRLLSRPYLLGEVTCEDSAPLSTRFPFMTFPALPLPVADYTIMLVTLWLYIEEMYHRGMVLPEQIMQALQKKTATLQGQDCREEVRDEGEIVQP